MDTRHSSPSKLWVVFAGVVLVVGGDAVAAAADAPVDGGSAKAIGPGNTFQAKTARGYRTWSVAAVEQLDAVAACHTCRGA